MKYARICFGFAFLLAICSCIYQEQDIPMPQVSFVDSITSSYTSVDLTCKVTGNISAEQLTVEFSTEESFSPSKTLDIAKNGDGFRTTITGLEANKLYYYRYSISNRISSFSSQEVRSFNTIAYSAPSVTTLEAMSITGNKATILGRVDNTCGKPILGMGFYFGKDDSSLQRVACSSSSFSVELDNLDSGTTYFFQAFAENEIGLGKGEKLSFTTSIIEVSSVSLNKTTLSLTKGSSETLVATVSPSNATDKTVNWRSSNTAIVKVDSNGKVTAVAAGNATITAKAGEKSASCSVEVIVPVESVSLNYSTLTLEEGQSATLVATISPSDATNKKVTWTSSNTSVATVSSSGVVTAKSTGSASITVKTDDGNKTAICSVTTIPEGAVDLGLSVMWRNRNIGASKPEDFGYVFKWGETEPTKDREWTTYKWCKDGNPNSLTKYNTDSSKGVVDNKTRLDFEDDAARVNLGGKWRMPTKAEQEEFVKGCRFTLTEKNGVHGYIAKSKVNGNEIFLPMDYVEERDDYEGGYWLSENAGIDPTSSAWYLRITSADGVFSWAYMGRRNFAFVRAVCDY